MRRTAALIVGGGPAGSAAAITLARGGERPLLIERSADRQDVPCGGFLGWDALAACGRLGLDVAALGARPISHVRIVLGGRSVERRLPGSAAGLSRRALDAALLGLADAAGAGVERGVTAQRLLPGAVETGGATIAADAIILASGKHDVRGGARPRDAAGADPALGLRRRIASAPLAHRLADVIELHLFDRGYAGLLVQEDGAVNLCLSVAESRLRAAGGDISGLIAAIAADSPHLADALDGSGDWQTISRVPYGWRARDTSPGLFRVGDQAAVIPSLAGDGVAIALTSGRLAAAALLRGGPGAAPIFQQRFAAQARRPLGLATALRHAAERPALAAPLVPWLGRVPGLAALLASLTRIDRRGH